MFPSPCQLLLQSLLLREDDPDVTVFTEISGADATESQDDSVLTGAPLKIYVMLRNRVRAVGVHIRDPYRLKCTSKVAYILGMAVHKKKSN